MRDCTRYTINTALHVVTCLVRDAMTRGETPGSKTENLLAVDTIAMIGQLREAWEPKAPDMARRNGKCA